MANQLDNLQLLDGGLMRSLSSDDNIQISGSLELQNDVVIQGNLVVQGDAFSVELDKLRIQDNHILLNDGYTTVAAQTAGLVANYLPTSTADSVATGGFTAGVPATSNPTIITSGSGTFSVGDFILVSGAADEANNGLFEVLSHSGTTLTVRGVGLTATVEDFTDSQFVTDTTAQGTITKVNVSILRAGTDGSWETAKGSSTGLSFTDLSTGGNTLQESYEAGNTITTSAGEGDVIIAGTEKLQVTATGGLNLDAPFDFDSTSFDVQMTGTNGFSIDGTAASNVSVTAGNLTLSTVTSGDIDIASAGDVDVDGVNVQLDASSAFSIDGAASSNVSVTGADLQLSTITTGELDLTSAELMDVNAGANLDIDVTGTFDMLSSGAFSIDGTGASNVSATSGNLTLSTITSGDVDILAVGDVDVDGTNVTIDASSAFSVDGAAASNVSVTGADLTLSTITSGELDLTAAGLLDVNAAANMDIDVTGTFDMLSSGAFSIDGTGASNVSATSGNLTLSTITSGSLNLTSAGDSTYTVPDPSSSALTVTDGTSNYLVVDSSAGAEKLDLPQFNNLSGAAGLIMTSNDSLVAGNLVQIEQPSGDVGLADADTGTLNDALVMGVSKGSVSPAGSGPIHTVPGTLVPVLFASAPAASSNGLPVYLSTTAGQATMTAPTGVSTVTYIIGFLQGADGADTTPDVLFMPQFISKGPLVS